MDDIRIDLCTACYYQIEVCATTTLTNQLMGPLELHWYEMQLKENSVYSKLLELDLSLISIEIGLALECQSFLKEASPWGE